MCSWDVVGGVGVEGERMETFVEPEAAMCSRGEELLLGQLPESIWIRLETQF